MKGRTGDPYRKGLSPTASQFSVKTFTESAVRFANYLNEAGVKDTLLEAEFERPGEFTQDGRPKFYSADIAVREARVIIETEGKGSRSKDNPSRDQHFHDRCYIVLHLSNELIRDYGAEVAELLSPLIRDRVERRREVI